MGFNEVVGSVLDPVLGIHPFWGLFLLTLALNLIITVAYKYLTDQQALKSLKDESKELQKKLKELKDKPAEMMAVQKKSFENMIANFKHNLIPMIVTAAPLIILLGYFRAYYAALNNPDLFWVFGWLGTYVIFSIVFNLLFRKLLKVH